MQHVLLFSVVPPKVFEIEDLCIARNPLDISLNPNKEVIYLFIVAGNVQTLDVIFDDYANFIELVAQEIPVVETSLGSDLFLHLGRQVGINREVLVQFLHNLFQNDEIIRKHNTI